MKNDFCDLKQEVINKLPDRFKGFLLSPFQFNRRNGYVMVPEDTFKEMIDIIAEYAQPKEQQCEHVGKYTGMYEPFDTACEKCGKFCTETPNA